MKRLPRFNHQVCILILNSQIGFVSFFSNHSKILDSICLSCEPTLLRWPRYSHLQSFTGSIIVVIRAASAAAAAPQPQAPASLWATFRMSFGKWPFLSSKVKNLRTLIEKFWAFLLLELGNLLNDTLFRILKYWISKILYVIKQVLFRPYNFQMKICK